MLKTKSDFDKAMRSIIVRVQNGEKFEDGNYSVEEMEVLAECIKNGYINGEVSGYSKITQQVVEYRDSDGKMHPIIYNNIIPPKGLVFLNPQTDWKFIVPTVISIIALIKSFLP